MSSEQFIRDLASQFFFLGLVIGAFSGVYFGVWMAKHDR